MLHVQSILDISKLMGLFFYMFTLPEVHLICISGNLDL